MATLTPKVTLVANGETGVVDFYGGECFYSAVGTFGGGTTTLLVSYDDGAVYTSAGTEGLLTAAGTVRFTLPACKFKVGLTGATGPSVTISIDSLK